MSRQRTVLQTRSNIDPALAIRLHHERIDAGDSVYSARILRRPVRGRTIHDEVRCVESDPLLLLFVPPDQLLSLGPGLTVKIRGCAIVENASIVRPSPGPFRCDVILFPV